MRHIVKIFLLMLIAIFACGCGGGGGGAKLSIPSNIIYSREEAVQQGSWTILVYLDADNDLESAAIANFNQMEMIGSSKDVRIVVQIDRIPGYDSSNGNWTDTRRYLITRDNDISKMNSVRLDEEPLGELDMGSWHTLRSFVQWGVQQFPADNYCLIIWDHGNGWQIRNASIMPEHKYVAIDSTNYGALNVNQIPNAISGLGINVLAFDACYMQQFEVAYELRNSADYLVASAASEPSPGYNYRNWLVRVNAATTPVQLCNILVEEYARAYPPPRKAITLSAVDLSKMDELARALSNFSQILIANSASQRNALSNARLSALNYSKATGDFDRYSIDLLDYAGLCAPYLGAEGQDAYQNLADVLSETIIAMHANPDMPKSNGLAIYLPPPHEFDYRYNVLAIAANTLWNEWIQAQQL